jgi:hypothetical protein
VERHRDKDEGYGLVSGRTPISGGAGSGWLPGLKSIHVYGSVMLVCDIQLGMRSSGSYCKWRHSYPHASFQLAYWARLARWTIAELNGARLH